jgi:hypothetical protein
MIFKLNFQVDGERAHLTEYEKMNDDERLLVHARTLQIRFQLDEEHFEPAASRIFLKCVASVEMVPYSSRQTSELVYIQSDDLQNLRLINSQRGEGECLGKSTCLKFAYLLVCQRITKALSDVVSISFARKKNQFQLC